MRVMRLLVFPLAASAALAVFGGEPQPGEQPKVDKPRPPAAAQPPAPDALPQNDPPNPWAIQLVKDLASPDPKISDAAVEVFVKELSPPPTLTALSKASADLASAQPETRAAALKELHGALDTIKRSGEELLIDQLGKLKSDDAKKKQAALDGLGFVIDEQIKSDRVRILLDSLASADPAVKAAAMKSVKDMGADAASPLVDALSDERAAVRHAAADLLIELGPAAKDTATDLAFLLDNEDKVIRKLAGNVLERLGPDAAGAITDLVGYLDNEEKTVRRSAASILKKIGPAAIEAAPDLIGLLTNEDKNVRMMAKDILLSLGSVPMKDYGELTKDKVAELRKDEIDSLTKILDDGEDTDAQERAADILAAIGPDAKAALPALKQHANSANADVKKAVEDALKKIETK